MELFDGRYELLGAPKSGGMSRVYQARETSSRAVYALKVCKDSSDLWLRTSFEAEHKALSNLQHPNIVRSYGIGITQDRTLYLVLEWVPRTLYDEIVAKGKSAWPLYYVDIGKPMLDALRYAHGRRVAHRDLKPTNVLLTTDGVPKITDFGIARNMEKVPVGPTLRGAGSPPYTPHEVDDGIHTLGRDCFSWAVITLSCLTGRIFSDMSEVMGALEAFDPELIPVEHLKLALSQKPSARYTSASEFAADIEAFERKRIEIHGESIHVAITLSRASLQKSVASWNATDLDTVRARVLADINETSAVDIISQEPLSIAIVGASCVLDGEILRDSPDQILISRIQVLPLSVAERRRDDAAGIRFVQFTDRIDSSEKMRRNLRRMMVYVEAELSRKELERQEASREKYFNALAGYIREKERYYRDQSASIHYSKFRSDGPNWSVVLEREVDAEELGESLIVDLPNARPVVFDVVQVNLDQIILHHKVGAIEYVPESGNLKPNRTADLMALGKQRSALETIRSGMAVSPQLGDLLRDPKNVVSPEISGLPAECDLSPDKLQVLEKALGIVQFLVVEGPPGTGKTTLIAELIAQFLARYPDRRILLSSQTHVALDHVIAKLKVKGLDGDVVRIAKNQERKVDPNVASLLLSRKVEEWSKLAESRSRTFIERFATRLSLDSKEMRVAILGNERLRRLARIAHLSGQISALEARQIKLEADRKRRTEQVERLDADEIVMATSTLVDELRALRAEREQNESGDIRVRMLLADLGPKGKRLAGAGELELTHETTRLIPSSEEGRLLRAVIELQHQWFQRLGASQDFYPAVLKEARVVAGTCVGLAGVQAIYEDEYDLCIVDEASKATSTETLIPMSRSKTWMLVGDPKQLPPFMDAGVVIQVDGFGDNETNRTLLDYLLQELPDTSKESLKEQHRMVKSIGELISHCFYDKKLINTRKDAERSGSARRVFPKPVTWVSTTRLKGNEFRMPNRSFRNSTESGIVVGYIEQLNKAHKNSTRKLTVAVIAGYVEQIKLIKDALGAIAGGVPNLEVECNTIDAFQGRDADVCIYSVTRRNPELNLGFQKKKPRLNVALSRARDALAIVGDISFCKACSGENPFSRVIEFIEEHPESCEVRTNG